MFCVSALSRVGDRREGTSFGRDSLEGGRGGEGGERQQGEGAGGYGEVSAIEVRSRHLRARWGLDMIDMIDGWVFAGPGGVGGIDDWQADYHN